MASFRKPEAVPFRVVASKSQESYSPRTSELDGWITSLTFSGDTDVLASTYGGSVFTFNRSLSCSKPLETQMNLRHACAQGSVLKVLTFDGVHEYSRQGYDKLRSFEFEPGDAVAMASRGGLDFVAGARGSILRRDGRDTKATRIRTVAPPEDIKTTRMAVSDTLVATSGRDHVVRLYSAEDLSFARELTVPSFHRARDHEGDVVEAVAWHKDTRLLYAQARESMTIYDAAKDAVVCQASKLSDNTPHFVTTSGKLCVSASASRVFVWDSHSLNLIHTFPKDGGPISTIALRKTCLAIGTRNGDVQLYELRKF